MDISSVLSALDQHSFAFVQTIANNPTVKTFGPQVGTLNLLDLVTGQLRTLYSGPSLGDLLFSPDQRSLALAEGDDLSSRTLNIDIIDLTTGKLHKMLSSQQPGFPKLTQGHQPTQELVLSSFPSWHEQVAGYARARPFQPLSGGAWNSLIPLKWANNNSLFIRVGTQGSPGSVLRSYLVHDTSKGVSQQQSNLQYITGNDDPYDPCDGFDVTPDNQQLVCSHSTPDHSASPATIKVRQPVAGETFHTIYQIPEGQIEVRAISHATILFMQGKPSSPETLWKVNTDSSGLTQLMNSPMMNAIFESTICNGSLYAIKVYNLSDGKTSLVVGSLAGGTPKTITEQKDELALVGWLQL
jgi:hypothetical protein